MPKIIGFYGSYPADICMYAAYALQNAGKRVCVIDLSEEGILFRCIPAPEECFAAVTFHDVDFIWRKPLVQWHELDYDFVLVHLGERPQELCLAVCSQRILVMDCERSTLDFYDPFLESSGMPAVVLLRGFCVNRTAAGKIMDYFGRGSCLIERWLLLPFHEADEAYRIHMQYQMLSKFKHISADLERVLVQLLLLFGMPDRVKTARAVRNAKQGKTAEMLYLVS